MLINFSIPKSAFMIVPCNQIYLCMSVQTFIKLHIKFFKRTTGRVKKRKERKGHDRSAHILQEKIDT